MALIIKNRDGTFVSRCALCGRVLTEPIFATSHFLADPADELYRFSDASMHWDCYVHWPQQRRFAALYFEANLRRSAMEEWAHYWPVLLQTDDLLVTFGRAVDEVAVCLKKSGTTLGIAATDWPDWLAGNWQQSCHPGLECEAVAEALPLLRKVRLPME